jgi:hypothetical protein
VRVAVGHHHLAEARAVEHLALLGAVAEAHVGEHEPVDGVQRDVQAPVLPAQDVPVQGEAGAVGLHDLQGRDVVAPAADRLLGLVVALGGGERHDRVVVDHDEHLAGVEVHRRAEVLDRRRVRVGQRMGLEERRRPHDPAAGRVLREVARAQRVDLHLAQVLDPAPAQRCDEPLVGHRRLQRADEVLLHDRRLDALQLAPRAHLARGQLDERLVRAPGRPIAHHDTGAALDRVPGREADHHVLRRVDECDERERGALERLRRAYRGDGGGDLLRRQRIEGMGDRDRDAHVSASSDSSPSAA